MTKVVVSEGQISEVEELCKLFKLHIPDPEQLAYYVGTLVRSPEYTALPDWISAYGDLESFASEAGYGSARRYKLDHALPLLVDYIKGTEAYEKLLAAEAPGQLRTKDELKRNAGSMLLSIDVQSANFSALKTLDSKNELEQSWAALCARRGIHRALGLSKSFRQLVFGKTKPKRLTERQHASMLDLVDALVNGKLSGLCCTEETIVFISHDEIVIHLEDAASKTDPAARAAQIIAALSSMRSIIDMPLHTTIFRLDRIKKPVYLKTVYELVHGTLKLHHKTLYGVPGSKFYRYFKTHVLEEPLDERDLLFISDGELARWVVR